MTLQSYGQKEGLSGKSSYHEIGSSSSSTSDLGCTTTGFLKGVESAKSAMFAAQKIEGDRTVYGMELSSEYIEIILQRWENFANISAKRIN